MELNELIGRISFIRTRANLSARRLSMEIGKTESYINRMEVAKNFAPTFETLKDILDVCNTSIEEFFYYDIPAYRQDQQIIEMLKDVNQDKKAAIIALLKK